MYLLLVFCSGFAGLVYEILWMKQLRLLFGNTSHAAAATLAAFFGGLAVGSWLWGRRTTGMKNPLRVYAWLEVGIAVTALLYFVILRIYHAIYPALYQSVESEGWRLVVKFALALVLVFPPAFFMGGTIPVMGRHLIRQRERFGRTAALLYGVNTLGAALGAFLAGFFLPSWIGFRATCLSAMCLTGLVAATAFRLSRGAQMETASDGTKQEESTGEDGAKPRRLFTVDRVALLFVCFLSGFGFLALEVLWTRMFAQVLENSVYTFASILVVVLLCLSAGALIASWLARWRVPPSHLLVVLLLISGIAVAATPFVFMSATHSLQILAMRSSWARYIMMIFGKSFLTIGPPALVLGMVFPFLMKAEERDTVAPGRSLGRLAAINTAGSILGSVVCGFFFLEAFGMWRTMQILALAYLVTAVVLPLAWDRNGIAIKAVGVLFLFFLFTFMNPASLPVTSTDPMRHQQERILEVWEGSDCTVAAAITEQGYCIKVNSHYGLGSTGAAPQERLQADIPLMIYPKTESIFFLGMGTGITAGSALDPEFENVKRIVVCELIPEVITAAKKYMTNIDGYDFTGGLFDDPRSTVLAEDGRHYLMATDQRFDMVNGDLFVPFRSGVGNLYSKQHFENILERLEPGGVFVQWLPLYQVTEKEFHIIARTMLEVFPQVSLWRANFQPGEEVVAVVGHRDNTPLPASDLDCREDRRVAVQGKTHRDLDNLALPFNPQTILFFYCGNLTEAADLFEAYPVNSDDRPLIEYLAPRTYRGKTGTSIPWFVGPRLARLVDEIQQRCPPDSDPLLTNRTDINRTLPTAASDYHWARLWQVIGDEASCVRYWNQFLKSWNPARTASPDGDPSAEVD